MPASPPFTAGLEPGRLAGQVIVVLGAGDALGQQVAHTLAYLGAQVVVTAAAAPPDDTGAALAAGPGIRRLPLAADDEASLAALAAQVQASFGPVDALINCPAEAAPRPFLSLSTTDWDGAVSYSLRRAFVAAQAFLPAMLTRRQGTVLNLVLADDQPVSAAAATAQQGLLGLTRAIAAEVGAQGVRVLALAGSRHAPPGRLAGAAAYLLVQPTSADPSGLAALDTVLDRAGFGSQSSPSTPVTVPDRAAHLTQAVLLTEQLASLLLDTDAEFDRLPIGLRPMARGAFVSQVGYRSQDVLRAVNKLSDQLQRMQGSHSGLDTEFQVDYPRLAGVLERLRDYYRAVPDETARLTDDQALIAPLRHQMAEREALIHNLLAALAQVHA